MGSHVTPRSCAPIHGRVCGFRDPGGMRCLSLCQALPDLLGQEAAPLVFFDSLGRRVTIC